MTAFLPALIHHMVFFGFVGLLIWAAVSDLTSFVIPNSLSAAIALLWPAFALTGAAPVAWLAAPGLAVATLATGLVLFSRGLVGGGDVKLMSAIALWAGPHLMLAFVLLTSVAGGLLSIAVLVAARLRPASEPASGPMRRSFFRTSVPYGAAIALGGLGVAANLAIA